MRAVPSSRFRFRGKFHSPRLQPLAVFSPLGLISIYTTPVRACLTVLTHRGGLSAGKL